MINHDQSDRILCVSAHTAPTQGFGGPAVVFRTFLDFLKEREINFVSISTSDKKTYSEVDGHSQSIFYKSPFFYKYGFSVGILLFLIFNHHRFRYFALNGLSNVPVLTAAVLALMSNKKIILFTHGGLEGSRVLGWGVLKRLFYRFNTFILKSIDFRSNLLVVYQTEDELEKSTFNASKSIVCANYPESFFQKEYRKDYSSLSITYIGRFATEKGSQRLSEFLDFFATLDTKSGHQVNLIIASDTVFEELVPYQNVKGISIFYNLTWKEITKVLLRSNVLYFPSRIENFGNSLVEGVAFGLIPCIYRDTHWSILLDRGAAITDSYLRDTLKAEIIEESALQKMAIRGKKVVLDEYIRGKDMSQILEFIV